MGPAVASRYGTAPLVAACVAGVAVTQLWLGLTVSAAERVSCKLAYVSVGWVRVGLGWVGLRRVGLSLVGLGWAGSG